LSYIPNDYGFGPNFARLATIVAKEGPFHQMLKLIQKHRLGIPRKELLQVIARERNRKKLIMQAIYLGLISQKKSVEFESDNDLFYHLTERGFRVLNTCKKL